MDESIKDNNASAMSIDEKTAYDAFVKLMASLIRKYGPKIEEEETKDKE